MPERAREAYQQRRRGPRGAIWSRQDHREVSRGGCARGRDPSLACAPEANGSGGRIGNGEVPARSGQSGTASCCVARSRPLRKDPGGDKLAIGDRLSTAKVAMPVRVVVDSLRCCAPLKVMKSAGGSQGSSKVPNFRGSATAWEKLKATRGCLVGQRTGIQCGFFVTYSWSHCNGAFEFEPSAPRRAGARTTIGRSTPGFGGWGSGLT
jgi:hypothetical protein